MSAGQIAHWIYNTPSWIVTLLFLVVALAVALLGLAATYALMSRDTRERHGELTSFTVSNIAVLYAVLLAFIAVATWETYSQASELAETEANLAGNLYRDTTGLPAPMGEDLGLLVRTYLRTVVEQEWRDQSEGVIPREGWPVLDRLHRGIAAIQPATAGQTVLMQEMLRGLNQLYSARTSRLDAVGRHIPALVWSVIVAVGALTIGYSCLLRAEWAIMHVAMLAGLTTALTLVIALIVELDYPFRGAISVTAESYQQVLDSLGGPGG